MVDYYYHLSAADNQTDITAVMRAVNNASGGLFGSLLVIAVFVILLWALLSRSVEASVAFFSSGLVCLLISLILVYMDLLPMVWVIVFFVVAAASGYALYRRP